MRVLALSFLFFSGIGTTFLAQAGTTTLSGQEVKFFNIVNQFRQMLNVPVLTISDQIQVASRNHTIWMVNQDVLLDPDPEVEPFSALNHYGPTNTVSPFQRMKLQGYTDYTFAGENISCGNGDAVKTFQQFALSPKHLVNLVNAHFRDTGIAREGTGNEKCPFYWTHDFGTQQSLSKDGPNVTDITLIRNAIIAVSGPIPKDKIVALPDSTPADSGTTQPAPNDTGARQQAYNQMNRGGMTVSSQIAPIRSLQCVIPFASGRQLITPYQNTDTLLQAKKTSSNTYSVTLSYFLSGALTSASPIVTESVTITQNPDFPVVTLFVAPGSRLGGFMIQVNTETNQGQFDSYGISPGVSGSVMCTVN